MLAKVLDRGAEVLATVTVATCRRAGKGLELQGFGVSMLCTQKVSSLHLLGLGAHCSKCGEWVKGLECRDFVTFCRGALMLRLLVAPSLEMGITFTVSPIG